MKFNKIFGMIIAIVICCLCFISSTAEQGTVANSTGSSTVYRPEATVADSTGSSTGNRPVEPKEATVADSTGSSTGNKTYEPEGVEYNPNPEPESESDVLVYGRLILPKGTTDIEEEAFWGNQSLIDVVLPEGLLRIGSKAFQNTYIRYVILPRSLEYFAPDAFDFSADGFEFYVYEGSDAAQLCVEYGLHPKVIGGNKVGVSMPTIDLKRWAQDGANLKTILEGYGYEVDLQYASNDVVTQLRQILSMIDDGCEVIAISAVEGSSLGIALNKAAEKGVKVIAYDRLLMDNANVDYYVTFDNYKVGSIQGTYVKDALDLDSADGPFYIEFSAGDPGDRNASFFYNGAMDVLKPYIDAGKVIVKSGQTDFASVATPGWKSSTAQSRAEDILSYSYGNGTRLDAWVCSNDSIALGVTNALEGNYTGNWPIITGQDCDIQNVRNIIAGKQAMSVFKDTRTLAAQAAKMVDQIMNGEVVDVNDTETYNNNTKIVPTFLCDPVFCDANNYRELLIDSGFYTEDDIGAVSPQPTLAEADIQMSETVPVGKNCSFSFSPVENATSYTASFKTDTNEIISWGSTSALPNTNLTIPGYWLDNGSYLITVTASANGYSGSTSTWTFTAAGDERPAPAVEVNRTNVSSGGTCTFTVNTKDANDLRYRVGNNYYTNHINVLDDETEYTTSFYNTGDYEYRFTVRRGNTWSEWSEPIIIHVSSETNLTPPTISVLSTLEEGRDLIVSLSEVTGAIRYGIDIYYDNRSIYSNYWLSTDEISSIELPGYNISAGPYTISAYSYNGNLYSNTTYKDIVIRDADKPDAPTVEPPEENTVAINSDVSFVIDTTGADKIAIRYFRSGYTYNAYYDTKAVVEGTTETTWTTHVAEKNTWKYAFSVRKDGVWSFWSSPITITIDNNGGGTYPQGNGIKIGIINLDPAESGYREANVRSLNYTFTAENGYDASFVTAPTADKQLEAANTFITNGVKYILVSAAETTGWDEVLQEAKNAGIGVFLFDRMIDCDPSLYTAAVVSDMAEEGKTAVAWLESLNLPEYKILHIQGQLGSNAQIGRSKTLIEKCLSDRNWNIVRQGTGGDSWDPEEARKITQAAIDAGVEFNIVYAENDGMAAGAVEALDAAGITHGVNGDVIIMGFDCNKWALRKLLAGEWNYDGQCSPFQAPYIDQMIKTLEAGGTITSLNNLHQFITPEFGFDARTITQNDIDTYGLGD